MEIDLHYGVRSTVFVNQGLEYVECTLDCPPFFFPSFARTHHIFKLSGPWSIRAGLALRPGPRNVGAILKVHADRPSCRNFRRFMS